MKRKLIVAVIAAILSTAAWAQMGPGMMGGYGPGDYGPGPGMMGGYGPGYGMGPGMMGGYGPGYGMGPGMMGSYGPGGYNALKLSDEQRRKIADIQEETWQKQWVLMKSMHELQFRGLKAEPSGKTDDAEARKLYQATSELHKQMFENSLDTRKRIDAVLTKEQREQLQRGRPGG